MAQKPATLMIQPAKVFEVRMNVLQRTQWTPAADAKPSISTVKHTTAPTTNTVNVLLPPLMFPVIMPTAAVILNAIHLIANADFNRSEPGRHL